jgi:hypothetical protein
MQLGRPKSALFHSVMIHHSSGSGHFMNSSIKKAVENSLNDFVLVTSQGNFAQAEHNRATCPVTHPIPFYRLFLESTRTFFQDIMPGLILSDT